MDTSAIYEKYMIPENLQIHMLRVGSLAKIISGKWMGETINGPAVVDACLFHDMAKPMNFDLEKQAMYGMDKSGIEKLRIIQNRLRTEYGDDEHEVTQMICREIGLDPEAARMIANLRWNNVRQLEVQNDFGSLLVTYCDMRTGPNGIMPLRDRLNDLTDRTGQVGFEENGLLLEKIIKAKVSIDLDKITQEEIEKNITPLLRKSL